VLEIVAVADDRHVLPGSATPKAGSGLAQRAARRDRASIGSGPHP
jgi:hypothetical protein